MEQGYVHVYTGNGKGKTTSMLGLTLRACGAGMKVYICQFMKSMKYNEALAIEKYLLGVEIYQYGTGCIINRDPSQEDVDMASTAMSKALEALQSGKYDIVMLDEINIAAHLGILSVNDILDLISKKPINVELVLTGRNAALEVIEAADLVSEIMEVKHYYNKGIMAREGIEK